MSNIREFTVSAKILRSAGATLSPAFVHVREGSVAYVGAGRPEGLDPALPSYVCGAITEPLYDAHVHLFLTGSHDKEVRKAASALSREEALARALTLLEGYRAAGVAGVRDGGDPWGLALEAAKIANAKPGRYARVYPSGEPVYRRGGYGAFLGSGAEGEGEARELIRQNAKAGATQIKVLATGLNSLEVAGKVGGTQFSGSELIALAACASDAGLRLMIHSNGPSGDAIKAFPASLEHGFWMEDGDLPLLAGSGVVWNPTLVAWSGLLGDPALPERQREVVLATDERQRGLVEKALSLGVRVGSGSDAGTPGVAHAGGLVTELRALASCGLGAAGALAASNRVSSALLCPHGMEGLNPGGKAGFIMLEGDPAEDISCLARPTGVFIGGELTILPNLKVAGRGGEL